MDAVCILVYSGSLWYCGVHIQNIHSTGAGTLDTIHHTILFIILLTLIVKPRTFRKANLITKLAKILTERRH